MSDGESVPRRRFGSSGGQAFRRRPGAYGIARRRDRVLVLRRPGGAWLPGGGLEAGEPPREGLRRECREELGLAVAIGGLICRADQMVQTRSEGLVLKQGAYYSIALPDGSPPGAEPPFEACWIDVETADDCLTEEGQRWALRVACGLDR